MKKKPARQQHIHRLEHGTTFLNEEWWLLLRPILERTCKFLWLQLQISSLQSNQHDKLGMKFLPYWKVEAASDQEKSLGSHRSIVLKLRCKSEQSISKMLGMLTKQTFLFTIV